MCRRRWIYGPDGKAKLAWPKQFTKAIAMVDRSESVYYTATKADRVKIR
jgi:hypothetical protein